MASYEDIMKEAWKRTCEAYEQRRFTPELEEDIQCYLYHECLVGLKEDATKIHAKVSRGEKTKKGEWVFPDLSFGNDEFVVEIKFVAPGFTSQQAGRVKRSAEDSMEVMSRNAWYKKRKRMLVFFDAKHHVWQDGREEIQKAGPGIPVLFYPKDAASFRPDGSISTPKDW